MVINFVSIYQKNPHLNYNQWDFQLINRRCIISTLVGIVLCSTKRFGNRSAEKPGPNVIRFTLFRVTSLSWIEMHYFSLVYVGALLNPSLQIKIKTSAALACNHRLVSGRFLILPISTQLKLWDTIGKCQRLLFTVGVSQHMHKLTNL